METTEQQRELSAMFKALGDPTRLRIFEFLRSCCGSVAVDDGGDVRPVSYADGQSAPTVGDVCCHVSGEHRITSAISFHLKELRQAGLIVMERRGKNFICSVAPSVQDKLAAYFGGKESETCCGCDK
jgi:ArsR family transcriptional regulator, arsenate/arsenite/antimonite-responsive transcriptional repressor